MVSVLHHEKVEYLRSCGHDVGLTEGRPESVLWELVVRKREIGFVPSERCTSEPRDGVGTLYLIVDEITGATTTH
jgi:hypothetical protein